MPCSEKRRRRQRLGEERRVQLAALDRVADPLDVPAAGRLGRAVEVGLAHHEAGGVRRERQPVLLVRGGAGDDLDGAVVLHDEVAVGQLAGGRHRAVLGVAVGLGADAEVGDRAARAGDPVGAVAADVRRQVDVVGVVGPELDAVQLVQAGEVGIGVLDRRVQHLPEQAGQVAVALGPVERGVRRAVAQHDLAGLLQGAAELRPRLPGETSADSSPMTPPPCKSRTRSTISATLFLWPRIWRPTSPKRPARPSWSAAVVAWAGRSLACWRPAAATSR